MENKYEYRVETRYKDEKYSEIIGFKEIKKQAGLFIKSRLF